MRYTINNPKKVKYYFNPQEKNFTGVIQDNKNNIAFYENGKLHRINAPAVILRSGNKSWFIYGKCHRENGPAVEFSSYKEWWFDNKCYGYNNEFTDECWTKKWQLEIFK